MARRGAARRVEIESLSPVRADVDDEESEISIEMVLAPGGGSRGQGIELRHQAVY